MTITLRATKGSVLTHEELDANFIDLNSNKAALAGSASQSFSMLNGTVNGLLSVLSGNVGVDNGGASGSGQQFFGAAGNVAGTDTTGGVVTVFGHAPNAFDGLTTPPYDGSTFVGASGILARGYSESSQYRGSLEFWVETENTPRQGMLIGHAGAVTIPGTLSLTGASSTLGYGTGAGGTVTQATSKSTAVTLNKACGRITTAADALAGGASVIFTLNNSLITAADTVLPVTLGTASYVAQAINPGTGACGIRLTNITGGSLSEAVAINFAIIKGATS